MRHLSGLVWRSLSWYSVQRATFYELCCELGPGKADLLLVGTAIVSALVITDLIRLILLFLF